MTYLRALTILVASATIALGGPAAAGGQAAAPAAQPSAFLGQWELDLTRLPDTYGPAPKRVVYAFRDVGAGLWTTTIDITARDGTTRHIAIRYRRDGKAVAGEGDRVDGDSAALGSPNPNVLVMTIAKDKHLGSVRVYTVTPDGREMTESAAATDGAGAPFVRQFHFKRIG